MSKKVHAIGLDLGGTSIKYGICSSEGEVVKEYKTPIKANATVDCIINDLVNSANRVLEFAEINRLSIKAIGVGTPGCVDVDKGYLTGNTPNFKYWRDISVRDELEKRLSRPVFVDNDANAMTFGEFRFGAGAGYSDIVCITLGTGIGGGLIIGDRLFRGSNYAGSEFGHIIFYDKENKKPKIWENYASATAMINFFKQLAPDSNINSTVEIFKRYHNGEQNAIRVIENEIEMVSVGIATLINIFNPQMVIIGGGVSEAGDWFINRIAKASLSIADEPAAKDVKIVPAKLGNKAGWLGAAALALENIAK